MGCFFCAKKADVTDYIECYISKLNSITIYAVCQQFYKNSYKKYVKNIFSKNPLNHLSYAGNHHSQDKHRPTFKGYRQRQKQGNGALAIFPQYKNFS